MKVGYSPGSSFKLLTGSGSRLGLTLIITFMVTSSPILIFLNPVLVSANSNNIDTSNQHSAFSLGDRSTPPTTSPTNVSPLDSDFTTQAAIGSLTARPTNNIVNTNSFYDIVFLAATAGTIKKIEVTFPAGTTIASSAFFNEAEGIGPGSASKSGQTITYTVTNAVNVPAGTRIRLEFANINNPIPVSASYQVTVTTRNSANAIIDGPTQSAAYTIKQIGANDIADNSITTPKIADNAVTTPKIEDNAVTTSKIADNAVIPNVDERIGSLHNVPPGTSDSQSVFCEAGEQVTGGGFLVNNAAAEDNMILSKSSRVPPNGWTIEMFNTDAVSRSFQTFAMCLQPFP